METLNGGRVDSTDPFIEIGGWGVSIVNSLHGIATGKNHDMVSFIWLTGDDILAKGVLPTANDPATIENNPSLWHVVDSFTEF